MGYLTAVILEYVVLGFELYITACTLSLAIGGYLLAVSGTDEFQRFAPIINEKAQTVKDLSTEFKTLFTDFVDAHGSVKQFSIFLSIFHHNCKYFR